MSMLNKPRHLLAPLSVLLLGSPSLTWAEQAVEQDIPEAVQVTKKGARLSADDEGQLHLRIDNSLLTGKSDELKKALLEVVLNKQSYKSSAHEVDEDGKVHFLVQLGQDEAGTDIQLKPVSMDSPAIKALSHITTGTAFLISMKAVDYGHKYFTTDKTSFRVGYSSDDPFYKDLPRNYLRQGMLLSTFGIGEAISTTGSQLLGRTPEDRTNFLDVIPDVASTLAMGTASMLMNDPEVPFDEVKTWGDMVGVYAGASATNTFTRAIKRATESAFHDFAGLDDKTAARSAQATQIVIISSLLAGLNQFTEYHPGTKDAKVWSKNYMTNALAITATYKVQELATDLIADLTENQTLADFAAAGVMAAGAGAMQAYHKGALRFSDHSYKATTAFMAAEAAGMSLGLGLQKTVNALMGDEHSTQTRAARIGSSIVASMALKGATILASKYFPGGDAMKVGAANILSPMADGVIISNVLDIMSLTSDLLVEPWVVKPLASKLGLTNKEKAPTLRLRATVMRRPAIEGSNNS